MPFLAIGSSGLSSAKTATSSEVVDKLEALGVDQPLPNDYFQDRIRLLVQSRDESLHTGNFPVIRSSPCV